MVGDLPSVGNAEAPRDEVSPSVTDIPHVPRTPMGADATDGTSVVGGAASADPPASPIPAATPATTEPAPLDPVAVASVAAMGTAMGTGPVAGAVPDAPPLVPPVAPGQPGLLYYAVYLPTPSGVPGGLPLFLPAAGGAALPPASLPPASMPGLPFAPTAPPPSVSAAQAHNQKLLVTGIIAAVLVVHLPWLVYLFAVHACWGTFLESCYSVSAISAEDLADPFAEAAGAPMLFARVVYLMLRVQAVLAGDWGQFSQAMQVSTGAGSFILTRIVASNGLVAEGRLQVWLLAASSAFAFGLLFWAELHLLGDQTYPELGAQTVLAYIDQNLPVDFLAYSNVEASLKGYLQFLRLADALILGAALAMPTTRKSA